MTTPTPNFFIVGAPKCGTTALYEQLKQHPDIFMPTYKEPHHFATDFSGRYVERFRDRGKYLALFDPVRHEKHIGEGSVYYLYSKAAPLNIHAFNPASRIIVMLRNPVEMLHSFYHQLLYVQDEDIVPFEAALAAEPERRQGKRIPPTLNAMVEALYYSEVARFAEQIERYLKVFPREQVQILLFDDFKADNPGTYRSVLTFLGVEDTAFQPDFRVVNPNKFYKNRVVQTILLNPPKPVMQLGQAILPVARPIYWWLRRLNSVERGRQPLSAELRAQLQRTFLPDVERLSRLLDRDLTGWCR